MPDLSFLDAAAALIPVCLFLAALVLLDSYKLVRPRWVGYALAAGAAAAALSFVIQTNIITGWGTEFRTVSLYIAPAVEEILKAALLVYLIRSHRVGFQVDAAILGFAVGTGFALAENVYYLTNHSGMGLFMWLLRGLGTAVMHGGTTCLFGIISRTFYERLEMRGSAAHTGSLVPIDRTAGAARLSPDRLDEAGSSLDAAGPADETMGPGARLAALTSFLPGLAAAYALHAAFNHFILPPFAMTALIIVVFPLLIVGVFHQSERTTRHWLGTGFDTDQAVLEALTFGNVGDDPIGRYLQELRDHFPGEVVADMLCLLRLRAEVAVKAKGLLMMREAGFRAAPAPDVAAILDEIDYLKQSIGPTGMLALSPFVSNSARENWQTHLLKAG